MLSRQNMDAELPLLSTKIAIPLSHAKSVRRPRLTERIEQGVTGPLTLLSAPAGFGKTNLLVEWAAESAHPVAWLTLNSDDNDPLRFFRYLVGAFQTIDPGLGEEALDFLQSTKGSQLEMGLTLLINEISAFPKNIILVLDDFHVLENRSILDGIDFLLKNLPHNLHLVIASRTEPSLDLAFLRAKGWVTELGAEDLRFTQDEVAQFFQQTMGLELPQETVLAVDERTEGWIIGIQMAAISLRNQAEPASLLAGLHGDTHHLAHYLSEEVLNRQPEEVRQFLMRCSILEVLSGPLCEAVAAPDARPDYGAQMLERLDHSNLFLAPLDASHRWFRFHHMFADFLRHRLAETHSSELPLLHKRAAAWFEQHDDFDNAFKHAVASEDYQWAAALIERNIETLIKRGEIATFRHWIGRLPAEIIQQHLSLGLAYAWGLIAAYQLDRASFWLDYVQQTLNDMELPADQAQRAQEKSTRFWNLRGGLAICRSTLALLSGDLDEAAEYSRASLTYLNEDNPFIRSLFSLQEGYYYTSLGDTVQAVRVLQETAKIAQRANNLLVLVLVTCQLAEMQALQGHLSQALVTLQKAEYMAVGPDSSPLALRGIVDNTVADILRERGALREAKQYLERGRRLTQGGWEVSGLEGMITLARVLQSQGDSAGADALIEEASQLALSTEASQWDDVFASAVGVRLALQREDLTKATQWWKKSGLSGATREISPENYPFGIYEYLLLTQARFHIAIGEDTGDVRALQRSLAILQSLLPEVERFERATTRIEIGVLQALCEYALGDTEQAVSTLLDALALGEPEGYCRIYLDEGRPVAELLALCHTAQQRTGAYLPSLQYIESLLDAFQQGRAVEVPTPHRTGASLAAGTDGGSSVHLSAREIEVLSLIAEGRSNQEIAGELCLALNTVKRHASNIYAKLDVKKRTQAVSKARDLGLIS